LEITDVRVYPVEDEKVQAFVSIVFDRCFMVNDIKVIRGKDGLFVSMPSRKRKNGDFKDVAHPLNSETRRWVEEKILGSYRAAKAGETHRDVVGAATFDPPSGPGTAPFDPPSGPGATEAPSANGAPVVVGTQGAAEEKPGMARSLEELERVRLGDSFWGMS